MRLLKSKLIFFTMMCFSVLFMLNFIVPHASAADGTTQGQVNLLKNSDFESVTESSGVADAWTKLISSGGSGSFQVIDTGDATVQRAQQVSGSGLASGKYALIYQNVSALPNSEYTLSGRFKVNQLDGTKVQLYVDFFDANHAFVGSGSVETSKVSANFVTLQKSGNTPANAAKAKIFAILRSTSASGSGSFEVDAMHFTLVDTQAPSAPAAVTAQSMGTSANLSWTASSDNLGVAGYDIYNGSDWIGSTTDLYYIAYGLKPNLNYTFTVKARDAAGNVSPSASVDVTTSENHNLLLNSDFETVSGTSGVADAWTKLISSGGSGSFQVVDTGDATVQRAQQVSGSGLASGKYVSIYQNVSALPNSEYTLSGRFKVNQLDGTKVQLYVDFYDANHAFVGSGIVETSKVSANFVTLQKSGNTPANAAKAKIYAILRSTSASGSGSFEVDAIHFTLVDTQAPTAPVAVTAQSMGNSANLSWAASSDNLGVAGYDIYNGSDWIGSTTDLYYIAYGLNPNLTYTFTVKARDAAGNVSPSASVDVTTSEDHNLLLNSDFESVTESSGVADAWTKLISSGGSGSFQVVDTGDTTVQRAQQVSGSGLASGKYVSIYQNVSALPNSEYTLSGRFKVNQLDGTKVQLYVDFYDANHAFVGSGIVETSKVSANFVTLQKSGNTPANAAKAKIYAILRSTSASGSGSFEVDAIHFTATPTSKDITKVADDGSIVATLGSPLPLPSQIDATLDDGTTIKVDVSWDLRSGGYDDLVALNKPFVVTGQLINLPPGITNSKGLAAEINVGIAAPPATPDIKEIITVVSPVTVSRGTNIYDLWMPLPSQVEVLMDDNSRRMVDIYWETYKIAVPVGTGDIAQTVSVNGIIKIPNAEPKEPAVPAAPSEKDQAAAFTNSKNLSVNATITFASLADSASIIQSIPNVPIANDVEKQPNPTAGSLGLPAKAQAMLGNNSLITADVAWNIVERGNGYQVTGNLLNLPAGVVNPGLMMNYYIMTHELTDIQQVPYFNEPYVAHGVEKTVQGFSLPPQVEVTLYNGSKVTLPVTWMLNNVTYDPAIHIPQNFPVQGKLDALPAGVTNGRMLGVYTWVHVAADPDNIEITSSPAQITNRVGIGAAKTAAGLGLPEQVEVSLSNGSRTMVDVNWRLEWLSYDPASTNEQTLYVTGNFINLPESIYNSNGYNVSAKVIVKNRYITRYTAIYRSLENGVPKTNEGLQLPTQVESFLDDGSMIMLDVIWEIDNVQYEPNVKNDQYFWVYGTVTNLPAGITNVYEFNKAGANIHVQAYKLQVISNHPIPVQTVVENGVPATVEGFGLPRQVEVLLSDQSKIYIDVAWELDGIIGFTYDPDQQQEQDVTVRGTLTNLPDGIYDSQETIVSASVKVKKAITEFRYMEDAVIPRLVAPHGTAKSIAAFNLPSTVEAILSDNSRMMIDVEWQPEYYFGWYEYSPTNPDYQTFLVKVNFKLPPDVKNAIGGDLVTKVEVWADQSIKEVLEIPEQPFELSNGSRLPEEIDVLMDNGNLGKVGVLWELNNDQIVGSLILKDSIKNSRNIAFKLGFEVGDKAYFRDPDFYIYDHFPPNTISIESIQPIEIYAGEPLPTQVMAKFDDYNRTSKNVNICWYGSLASDEDTKFGIPCGDLPYNWINAWNKVVVAHIKPPAIKAIQELTEVYPYEDLPSQVTAILTNDQTIRVNVCWMEGNYPPTGVFSIVGYLCNLPDGMVVFNAFLRADTYLAPSVPEVPVDIPIKVVTVQRFNEIMSQSDLPKTVNVQLSDGRNIVTSVCWNAANLDLLEEDDIAIAEGELCKLSTGIINPDAIKSLAYFHKSVTDLYFDFDINTNDPSIDEQIQNVRFADSDGIIRIHVTSHDHPIITATASFNGKDIPLRKVSDNEFIAEWKPSDLDRGIEVDLPLSRDEEDHYKLNPTSGSFHPFEVNIYPMNDTVRFINKQVYIAFRNENVFNNEVSNLQQRVIQPASSYYNCLAYAIDEPDHWEWSIHWYEQQGDMFVVFNPSHEQTIIYMGTKNYVQTTQEEATVIAFGSSTEITHFAKYDPVTQITTAKLGMEELVETQGIPIYSGIFSEYGTAQLYFKENPPSE